MKNGMSDDTGHQRDDSVIRCGKNEAASQTTGRGSQPHQQVICALGTRAFERES